MKNLSLILLVLSVMLISPSAVAQLTKKEKKEWKRKAKQYKRNPVLLKELEEEHQALQSQVNRLKTEVNNLQSDLGNKDARMSELQDNITALRSELASTKSELSKAEANKTSGRIGIGGEMVDGVVFKVQIGAFRNKDLSKYFERHENFGGETADAGEQRITLGQFRDYWEADVFKKYLREMGVKDAWIVPYKDGQRVPLKDVLEGVITSDRGTK
jgi:DNA repair exonuclease SbcCD ATPase subunit